MTGYDDCPWDPASVMLPKNPLEIKVQSLRETFVIWPQSFRNWIPKFLNFLTVAPLQGN